MTFLRKVLRHACVVCALSLQSGNVAAEPENGWWWNPSESGRGFFIESTGGVIYLAGYFYADDGHATWLSSGGPNPDRYLYRGTLQSYRNGQTLFGDYRPPDPAVDVGPVEVKFTDDTHGTITWPGGTISIERHAFGVDEEIPIDLLVLGSYDPPFKPETGWWWNDAESGRGFSVEVQGSNMFVVSFMYDEAGNPLWYFSAGPMTTPTHYEGDVLLFAGGQTLTGPYRPPLGNQAIGRMTIDFAAVDDATITVTDGASSKVLVSGALLKRGAGPIRARPQLLRNSYLATDMWPQWVGTVSQHYHDVTEAGTTGIFTVDRVHAFDLQWIRGPNAPGTTYLARYTLASTSRFTFDYNTSDTSNGCTQSSHAIAGGLEGTLTIRADLTYALHVILPSIPVDLHEHCDDGMGNVSNDDSEVKVDALLELGWRHSRVLDMTRISEANSATPPPRITGSRPFTDSKGTTEWDLTARR